MASDLAADEFLKNYSPVNIEGTVWGGGEIELTVSSYITCDEPPPQLVVSVRALVFRDESILLMHNVNGPHIIPGGRVESGESHLDALRRELVEEAGVEITGVRAVGFMHLRHETPKPPDYPYLYPDLFWLIFQAEYDCDSDLTLEPDDYELSSEFVPIDDLDRSALTSAELAYLDRAYRARTEAPA